jgi:transcription initiation factor IIE alpha subunit
MALTSICPKCSKSSRFEVCESVLANQDNQVLFIRCGLCGAVVGVMDPNSNHKMIEKLFDTVDRVEKKLGSLEAEISQIKAQRK